MTPNDTPEVNPHDADDESVDFLCPDILDPAMVTEQMDLEQNSVLRGAVNFRKANARALEKGLEDRTGYGASLIAHKAQAVADGITKFLADADTGKPGKRPVSAKHLKVIDPTIAGFLALQVVIGHLHTGRSLTIVALEVGQRIEDEIRLSALRESEKRLYAKIIADTKSRVSYAYKRAYAVRQMARSDNTPPPWVKTDRLHVGSVLINIIIEATGLVYLEHTPDKRGRTALHVLPAPATVEWVTRRNDATEFLRPVYEPMVVPPRQWGPTQAGGYLTSAIPPLKLVKTRNKSYLADLASHDMPVVYAAINAVQDTAWQVNLEVLSVMNNLWDNDRELAGLPSRAGIAQPVKPHDIDTNEAARRQWRKASASVWNRNKSLVGSRIAINSILTTANRFAKYPAIYFPCQFDFRGRLYSVPTLSPQGADYTKGLLRFAKGKPLGAEGAKWLAYQGANLAGNDKVSLEDRVRWVLDNEDAILACAADPLGDTRWATELGGVEIDSPWQFLAFCFEWAGYRREGEGFVSHIPVAMDGSCSGLQHFSAMLKDPIGGAAVNLVPADKPSDVYGIVAKAVNESLVKDAAEGTEDTLTHSKTGTAYVKEGTRTLAAQWLEFGATRKVTKRPVMTLAYGSREYGFKQQLLDDTISPARGSAMDAAGNVDAHAFPFTGDGHAAAGYMAKLIWQAVTRTLVAAANAMDWLQGAARLVAKENLPVRWTTPVGFPVVQAYHDLRSKCVETSLSGRTQLRFNIQEETMDSKKMANSISPNFVHSCDAAHLTLTVVRGSQEGIQSFAVVHDSFGTTAADLGTLFRVVRESFVEIYDTLDVLADFRADIEAQLGADALKELPSLPEKGTLDVSAVVASDYCFA